MRWTAPSERGATPPKSGYHRHVNSEGLGRLTEGQKTCLRMVYRHMSSKDIARQLGVSSHTVDQRLRIAMQALGASSRIEAACMLAAEEGPYQRLIYQSPYIADAPLLPEPEGLAECELEREADGRHLRQAQAAYYAEGAPESRLSWPLRKRGERQNALGNKDTLIWMFAIPIGAMVAIGMLATGLNVLAALIGSPLAHFK
ncbi:MAG TPA: helix-turn-helix transcriptional regulator [Allosphingosinicella sp.]